MSDKRLMLFSGNSNLRLAEEIARNLSLELGKVQVGKFSDSEPRIRFECTVRDADVYVVQSTCNPFSDNLVELLVMVDALKRASAGRITAVIPYFGGARQDRKSQQAREAITARLVADLLQTAGVQRITTAELHVDQIGGFFNIPVEHVVTSPVLVPVIQGLNLHPDSSIIVSPDAGGTARVQAYTKFFPELPTGMLEKRRPGPNQSKVVRVVGDVKDRKVVFLDDMLDTCGTVAKGAEAVMENGATEVYVVATHGVFSGGAVETVERSCIKKVFVTNTIPSSSEVSGCKKIQQVSIAGLLANALRRVHYGDSVSSLY